MRIGTTLKSKIRNKKVKHFKGFPPGLDSDKDLREEYPIPDLLIIEEKEDGVFLFRVLTNGDYVGDTWHTSIKEAKEQAAFEYEDALDEWREIPNNQDPVKYLQSR